MCTNIMRGATLQAGNPPALPSWVPCRQGPVSAQQTGRRYAFPLTWLAGIWALWQPSWG